MAFAILRTGKLKTASAIRLAGGHNSRTIPTPNASGKILALVDPGPDPYQRVMDRLGSSGIEPRSNAVLAQEILMTASPEYFRPNDPAKAGHWEKDRTRAWIDSTRDWIKNQYGDRLVSLHLHLDESTPHLHAVVVPITDDGRLSARDMFGPRQLRDLQTGYAKALAPLGLVRGIEGSKAQHERIQTFYGAVNSPAPAAPAVPTPPPMVREGPREEWAAEQNAEISSALRPIADKAAAQELYRRQAAKASATAEALRRNSAQLRALPLPSVLEAAGLHQDPHDAHQWKGGGMRISLAKGAEIGKWCDHEAGKGGFGAIDLAIHVTGSTYKDAVAWLGGAVGAEAVQAEALFQTQRSTAEALQQGKKAAPPPPDPARLDQVRQYLTQQRGLAPNMVEWAIKTNRLYADARGNAVFRYGVGDRLGDGVELRGTIPDKPFHGYRGEKLPFLIPPSKDVTELAVVESAIDAMSYRQLHPGRGVMATGGGTSYNVLAEIAQYAKLKGLRLLAAFDNDHAGYQHRANLGLAAMHAHPEIYDQAALAALVETHSPQGKDWNDQLLAQLRAKAPAPAPAPASSFPQQPLPEIPEFKPRGLGG